MTFTPLSLELADFNVTLLLPILRNFGNRNREFMRRMRVFDIL